MTIHAIGTLWLAPDGTTYRLTSYGLDRDIHVQDDSEPTYSTTDMSGTVSTADCPPAGATLVWSPYGPSTFMVLADPDPYVIRFSGGASGRVTELRYHTSPGDGDLYTYEPRAEFTRSATVAHGQSCQACSQLAFDAARQGIGGRRVTVGAHWAEVARG